MSAMHTAEQQAFQKQLLICNSAEQIAAVETLLPGLECRHVNGSMDWTLLRDRSVVCFGPELARLAAPHAAQTKVLPGEMPSAIKTTDEAFAWAKSVVKPYLAQPVVMPSAQPHPASAPSAIAGVPRIVALEIGELLRRDFPPMEALLAPWLRKQHLSMIHAKRGVGKTHFALGVAYAVAGGGKFLKWSAEKPRRVLYVDGEMPGAAIKERLAAIVKSCPEGAEPPEGYFRIITPDVQESYLPDLGTVEGQAAFAPLLGDAELIVIDNLSTLLRAGAENEGESWLPMAAWALARRREGRAVVFVHHAGKAGTQRGSSRREDLLDVVINLRHPADYSPENGAQFSVRFEKSRGLYGEDVREIEATLTQGDNGAHVWTWREAEGATQDRVVEMWKLDMNGAEIAVELGVNKSTVSRALKKAREAGLIPKGGHGKA